MDVCDICSRKVGKRTPSVVRERDGGLDHAQCHEPTMLLLHQALGHGVTRRGEYASEGMARSAGHVVTRDQRRELVGSAVVVRVRAVCSCGWSSHWGSRREVRELQRAHLHDAAVGYID